MAQVSIEAVEQELILAVDRANEAVEVAKSSGASRELLRAVLVSARQTSEAYEIFKKSL